MPLDDYTAEQARTEATAARAAEQGETQFQAKFAPIVAAIKSAKDDGAFYVQHTANGMPRKTKEAVVGLLESRGWRVNVTPGTVPNEHIFDIYWD